MHVYASSSAGILPPLTSRTFLRLARSAISLAPLHVDDHRHWFTCLGFRVNGLYT
jgi:hypothetical protein